jgi:hypothetical protein
VKKKSLNYILKTDLSYARNHITFFKLWSGNGQIDKNVKNAYLRSLPKFHYVDKKFELCCYFELDF